MMESRLVGMGFGLIFMFLVGCKPTSIDPNTTEGRKKIAFSAGQAAALSYLAAVNPLKEDVAAIKVIVDKVRDNVQGLEKTGFIGALSGIEEAIDKLFPDASQASRKAAAKKLAKMLLEELDKVFKDHPGWVNITTEISGIVGSFASGASAGLG